MCILMVEWLLVQVNKTLLWLSLGGNWIGAEGVWALAESLQHNSSLQWLGLGGNDLGDRGTLHLASLLQGNYPSSSLVSGPTHCRVTPTVSEPGNKSHHYFPIPCRKCLQSTVLGAGGEQHS